MKTKAFTMSPHEIKDMCDNGVRLVITFASSAMDRSRIGVSLATIPASKIDMRIAQLIFNVSHKSIVSHDYASSMKDPGYSYETILFSMLIDEGNEKERGLDLDSLRTISQKLGCSVDEARMYHGLWYNHIPVIAKADNVHLWGMVDTPPTTQNEFETRVRAAQSNMFTLNPLHAMAEFNKNVNMKTYSFVAVDLDCDYTWECLNMPEEFAEIVCDVTGSEYTPRRKD